MTLTKLPLKESPGISANFRRPAAWPPCPLGQTPCFHLRPVLYIDQFLHPVKQKYAR